MPEKTPREKSHAETDAAGAEGEMLTQSRKGRKEEKEAKTGLSP